MTRRRPGDFLRNEQPFPPRPLAAPPPQPTYPRSGRDHSTRLNVSSSAQRVEGARSYSPTAGLLLLLQTPAHDRAPVVRLWSPPLPTAIPPLKDFSSSGCCSLAQGRSRQRPPYISTEIAPSASASASQAGPRWAQRWREQVTLPAPAFIVKAFWQCWHSNCPCCARGGLS